MALVFSSCGLGAVMNLSALKTNVSSSRKKFLTCKRSKIVASNQGTNTTASYSALATEPLTKEDLIAYFSSGCKTKEMWRYHNGYPLLFYSLSVISCPSSHFVLFMCLLGWVVRIGTEHEKIGFDVKTLRPMKYEQITALLNGISERFDWDKVMETGTIIGLKQVMYSFFFQQLT